MNFPQRLRELRESRGLSQEQLADSLNIPRSSLTHYEQDDQDRLPRRARLEAIADFFNVTVDYLLGRSKIPTPAVPNDSGMAYYDGGESWTEEEKQLAKAAVEDWRKRKKEMEKKINE